MKSCEFASGRWVPSREFFQGLPRGLEKPLLHWGVVLVVLASILLAAGFIELASWALLTGIVVLPIEVIFTLVYRLNDGSYHL